MKVNYHTHTARCRHASGSEREYVESAIKNGVKILGFSDHTPQIFPGDYYSNFRMFPHEAEGYFKTIRDLQREYAADIEIKVGVEVEYYPKIFDKLIDFLSEYDPDYFILGQHFIDNEFDTHIYSGAQHDENGLARYVDQTLEAMESGRFSIFAHPDLINYSSDLELYRREMKRLCFGAKKCGVPVELNLLGLSEHRHYPCIEFWKVAAEVGNDVVVSCDAHSPDRVAKPSEVEMADKYLSALGITPIENIKLIPPCR